MRELRSISFVFLARSVAGVFALLAVSAALAAGENTPTCAQPVNPAVLSPAHLLSADPVATIEDIGNVTIMDLTGEYDCLNQVPRQHIASHFLASHPDQYDFLVVFTTFEFNTGSVLAFYNPIRNDTVGIGLPLFDNSAAFSSAGRLHGFVDMAATSRYSFASNAPEYQGALNTLAHEFMHRWSAYLHFTDATGHDSGDLIGREDAHWSYFLDSDASVMLGNDWRLQEDGKFHSVDAMHRYSSLDMYAGGFAAASEVQPFTLIRNGDGGQPADVPRIGAISGGQGESITIDQVIAASGARVPSAANAQKDFSAAMILLKRPGESVSPGQLLELERFRVRFEQQFSEMTDGRGTMRIYTQSSGGAVAAPPTLHGSGSTSTPGGVAGAIAWLESRQKTDGRWEDRPATAMRDTVAVVRALSELDPGFAGNAAARAWIIAHPTANLDQRSWKLRGASLEVDAMALAAAQDSHGGFGIEPGWIASSFDTARVAAALADRSGGAAALDAALQSIGTQQNADGGFGVASGGHGKVLPTLLAADVFSRRFDNASTSRLQQAADWIGQQQAADGGIGTPQQSSLVNTLETYSLLGRLPVSAPVVTGSRIYTRQSQQMDGDWGGSVYLTATAALAYAHDQRPNLALVGAPTFAPVQPHDGERVTLSAVVSNSGNVAVGETLLRWFDGDPDQGGTQIGMDVIVPSLVSGSRVNTTQTWDTSNRAGEHALWVVLDAGATAAESSEQDNRGQLAVTVLPPSSLPDLSLSAADFSLTPTTVTALPSNVHVAGTLRDIGAQGVSSAVVRVFAKPDLTHALAQAIVDVAARGSVPISLDFNATTAATLNLLLRADPENAVAEASETNNDAELVLPFGQSLDLEVLPTDLAVLTATPLVGHSVAMDVTVHNRGTVDSPPVVLHAEIVQGGATATIFDAPVQLPAGQSVHRQLTWLPDQPGNVQLRISLDPANQVAETREDNNSAQLDFVVSALDQPDLTFVADSLGFLPTPALQGQPLTASVGVRNLSSVASGSFRVALYATDPSTGASPIGSTTVASLAASSETTATMVVPELELSGDQRLFAKIDADNQIAEVDETNNIIVKALRVLSLPDLAISVADIVLTPPLPVPGQAVQARVTVRNLGSQDANGTVVGLFEGDATTGVSVGPDQSLGTLAAGASMTLTWNWTLGLAPNARSVTAIADPGNIVDEGREDNNSASLPFDVQDGDFFASERYISPNGDGVQDAAVVVFRMPQAGPVEVDVVNGAQYAVRHFSDVALNGDLRGQIIWDGRDDRGRIVPDGDYRVVATGADHQGRGNLLVSVDNNLSSMLEAVDTPYGVYGVLPSNMFGTQIPPASSPLRDQLFGFWARVNNGVVGLYRTGTLFPAAVPIISDQWVTAFGLAQQSPHAALAAFAFSPDGSELAVVLAGQTAGGQYKVWVLRTAVDQMNAPTVVASFDNTSPMRVLGYFDANTMVVGPTSDGVLQLVDINSGVVTPYRSYADVPSGGQSTVLPVGILWSDQGQDYRDYPRLFVPRDQGSPIIHLETSAPESGIEYAYAAQLSPRKSAVAIHTRDGQREAVELVDLATGARSTLTQVVPGIAHGARSGEQASVGRYYGMGWLERQDQLLVQDAATRSLLVYAESGQRLSQTPFPELQRIGDYAVDGNQPPEHSDPTNVFPETFNGLTTDRCQGIDAGLGTERQIFDPATNRLFLGFGESVAHDVFEEGSWALESSSGIRDYFSADVDTGVVETIQQGTLLPLIVGADIAQHPLRHTCMDAPPKDWPLLILGDGARILEDGHVQTLSRGVLPKSWLDENNSLQAVWPDETRAQLNGHVFSSLLNLTAELQARTLGRGIELSGVAADRNFAYYKLDWAPIEQPNNWQALTPASPDQVFIDEFLNWVPPQSGTFVIRLTVVDKAGNSTSTSVTASSFDSSAIDNFSLSPRYFSPNGDGVKDQLVVKYRVRQAVTLDVRIKDANGNIVRSVDLTYGIADVGAQEFDWNGRNDSGQLLPDGRYRVDVDGFAGWVIIDTVAPELAGDIVQAYRKAITDDVSPLEVVNVQPEVRHAARDPNLVEVVLESALSGGDVWALLPGTRCCSLELGSSLDPGRNIGDPANWNGLTVPIDAFANHSFRMRATDAAGNIRLLALGNADEALPLSSVSGQKRTFAYQPPPFAQPPDALSLLPLLVEHDAEDYLQAWDVSGLVSRIAVETTPIDTPDQWIERGNYEIADVTCTMVTCGRDFKPGELHVPFDVDALPQGTRALVRLRGAHANGTQLYSNQGYIHVGGIEAPICNGTIEDVVPKISVSAVEFYDGPLASASLHFVSHSGEEELAAASSIGVEKANFILPATSDGSTAWVAGVDTQGYRHVSPVSILLCPAGPPNPPVDRTGWHIALNRKPVIQDQCDGRPSDQIMLDLSIREVAPPTPIEPLPSHIKLSYVDGISGLRVVLLERDVNESNASQATRTFTLSTVHWPEAEYEGRLDMTYPGGGVGSKIIQLPVVKQPPQIAITSPAAGQRVCAVPAELGNQTLQIAGSVDSLGASSYRIEFGLGARPPAFECKARRGEEPPPSLFQQEPECLPYMALTNIVGASTSGSLVNVRGKLETYNGISTVRLKGLNWSGGTVCTDSTIYLDSDIEYLESAPPKTMLPTMGLSIVGIAPMGDPAHMQGQFFLRANEPVQFAATVHRATIDHQSGALKLEEAVLTTLTQADSIEGNIDVVWDGRIGGDVVADGLYGIAATASDGCGHVKTIQYGAVVDSTPPLVALTAPAQGSSSAAAVIEIVGAVTDTALVGWSLDVSLAASPHSWQNLSAGGSPITTPAAIKAWSRGSVTGPVDLRLSAIDAFGNRAETHVSITLEDPPKLIGAAELQPPLFSPNGDGALDTTRLQLSLLQNASIDIRAGNASLYAGPTPAGISGLAWSGLDANGHPVPDGIYQMDIRATDPNGVAVPESLTLTATIDSTPPMVEVQQPNGAFAAASSSVRLRVEDTHLANFDARLTRSVDGVVVASLGGTQGGDVLLSTLADLADGVYALHVEARDGAANVTTRDVNFTIDATPPVVALSAPAEGALIASNAATSVQGSVNDAHLASYTLSVAPEQEDSWTELTHGSANVPQGEVLAWHPNLPDGRYRLRLRGIDEAGNTAEVIRAVDIDGTPPVAHISAPVDGGFLRSSAEIQGTATDAHFAGYRLSVIAASQETSGQWTDVYGGTVPVDAGRLALLTLTLPEDDYLLRLVVTDHAGLSSSDQVHVRIDTQAPPTPINLVGHVDDNRDSVLDWNAVAAPDLAGYSIYRGGERINATPVSAVHYVDAAAPEGGLKYSVRAIDHAGNESASSNVVTLLIDHTPPITAILRPIAGERVRGVYDVVGTAYSNDDFKQYRLSAQALSPAGTVEVVGGSTLALQGRTLALWNTLALAEETTVRLHLEADDVLGNSASADVDVVVDNMAPAAPTGLAAALSGLDAQVHWNPNSESDLLGYLLYRDNVLVNAPGPNLPADLRPFALTDVNFLDANVPDGQHSYVVYAIDRAGNVSPPSAPATLDPIDNLPPSMTMESPLAGARFDTSIVILATSRDTDIAEVGFSYRAQGASTWVDLGAALTNAPYRITWTPAADVPYGAYEIRALARDLGGRYDPQPPVVAVVRADLTPPGAPARLVAHSNGDTVHLAWNASGASDLAGYRIYRDHLQIAVAASDALTSDDLSLPDGDYVYTVTALDAYGNESTPSNDATAPVFSVSLDQPYSPTTASAIDLSGRSGKPGTLSLHVDTDSGSSDSTPSPVAGAAAFVLNAQSLLSGGNHFVARVADASGNVSRSAEVWVDRGAIPVAPTGVAVTIDDHTATLRWDANAEADVIGYRVFRNGGIVAPDALLAEATVATSDAGGDPTLAVDGDPQTYWETTVADGNVDPSWTDSELEIGWTQPRIVTTVNLTWLSSAEASGNVDLYAWSGHAWIRIAHVHGAASASQSIQLEKPYRTTRIKLAVHGNDGGSPNYRSVRLAELQLLERPVQAARNIAETLLDGSYHYQVSAFSAFAFESPLSSDVVASIGDAQGPDAVVLSGSIAGSDASLSWSASVAADVARFDLERDGHFVASVATGNPLEYIDHGLANGAHNYVVHAYDMFANQGAPSNTVTLIVAGDGPGVPVGLAINAPAGGGALDASWQAAGGPLPVLYVLRRATSAAGPYLEIARPLVTAYHDMPLTNGTTYYYTVEAIDALGNMSGPGAPASGTPRDHFAPSAPVLTYPTVARDNLTLSAGATDICGKGEAGTTIELDRGGSALATVNTANDYVTTSLSPQNYGRTAIPAPSGKLVALVNDFGRLQVIHTDNAVAAFPPIDQTYLQGWAAHGATLYYAKQSTGDFYRWELGETPQALALPITSPNAFAANAHETTFAIGGTYASDGQTPVQGVWLVDRSGGAPRRMGDLDPATLSASHALQWSPDGAHVLVVSNDGTASVIDAATATVATSLSLDPGLPVSWNSAGTRFAYARDNGQSGHDLLVFDIATQSGAVLAQYPQYLSAIAWSPADDALAILDVDALDIVDPQLGISILPLPYTNVQGWSALAWTASGRIVSAAESSLFFLDPPGWFCAPAVPLVAGANHFSSKASDASGNHGFPSAAIEVDVPTADLPDLAVSSSDIFLVPPSGSVGQSYSALITLRNNGAVAVDHPELAARLTAPDGSSRLLTSAPLSALPAGQAESITYALGTLAAAGSYRIDIVADPAQQVREIDEDNNTASATLTVSADGAPVLELNLTRTLFAPGDAVTGEVAVTNPGAAFSGHVHLGILDAGGELAANLGDVPITALGYGQHWNAPVRWDAQGVFAGNYRLRAQLYAANGDALGEQLVAFAIAAVRHIQLGLAADLPTQTIGRDVVVHSSLAFSDGNALLEGAILRLAALDAVGTELWHSEQAIGTLLPGYVLARDDHWPTSGLSEGVYTLRLTVLSAAYTASVDATVSLIATVPGLAIDGSITLDPSAVLIAGGDVRLRYRVANRGAAALTALQTRLRIVRATTHTPVSEEDDQFDLAVGAAHESVSTQTAPPLELVGHAAILEARLPGDAAGQWRLLAQQGFSVVDMLPPEITVLSPSNGVVQPAVVPFRATIVDRHSTVAAAEVSIDEGTWQPVSMGADGQYARGLAGLIDGPHTLSVRARDTWGNQAQTAPMPIIVDATPPLIVITGVADGDALNHAVAPQIAISDAHLASSDIRLNGVPFVSGTSVDSDENYVLSVRATDDAGNQSQRSVRFVINRVSPSVAITAPADGAVLAQSAIRVDVHSEAAAHVVLVTGVYQASAIADGAGNAGFDAVPLVDGLNRIEASASDRAGNIGGPVAINVTYQTVVNAPLTGTLQPDATDLAQGAALGVHLTVHNSNTSMVSSQQLRVQVLDASMSPLAEQLLTRDFTPQETFATDYSFASGSWPLGGLALALDLQQGGGWTRLDTKQITVVDLTPPLLALVAPSETDVLQGPITLHATASDGLTGIATVEASVDGGNWDALVAGVGDVYQSAEMALTDGDHQVDLRTHDGAGNSTSIGPVHFAVDNTPPLINIAGVAEGDLLSHAVSPVITVADAHLFTSDVRLNDVPFVSGTLINASGDYRIDVIASDVAGNRASSTLRFTLDLDPPTVVFTAPLPDAVVTVDTVEVIGQTEALAQVHLATGSFTVDVAADASGRFDVPGVPLQAGTNVLAARATDRAGNIGPDASVTVTYEVVQEAAVTGQIGVLTTPLKQGLPIDAPYAIQNTGGVALSALPLRFEMHALAGGDALVTEEFSLDLALGSHVDGIRHLATSTLVPGDYVLSLLADLPASGGPAAWVVLDTAAIALVGNPCYFNDVIFADGFDDANPHRGDFIFCNGFELNVATQSAVGIGYAPWIDATAWIATAVSPKDAAAKAVAFAWVHSRHTDNAQVDALTLHSSIGNPFASQRNRFAWPHEPAPDVLLAYAPVLPRRDWSRTSLMVERSGLQGIHLLADIADGRNLRLGQSEELR